MIKLKPLIENINQLKWILGYVDGYGKVHFKVVSKNDLVDSHSLIWPGPKHSKWRWLPEKPSILNTYGEYLDPESEDKVWNIIDRYGI